MCYCVHFLISWKLKLYWYLLQTSQRGMLRNLYTRIFYNYTVKPVVLLHFKDDVLDAFTPLVPCS